MSVTAALSFKKLAHESPSAFLGVERSARGMRWVERLDPSRAATALAIAQAHGLPELIGRLLAARGADAAMLSHFLDPSLRHLLPAEPHPLLGNAGLKYSTRNPANSILICEEWSGLRAPARNLNVADQPAPQGTS